MKIIKINVHEVEMEMKSPFSTSFGTVQNKRFYLIEVINELGISGWGEGVAFEQPWYTEETVQTALHMTSDFLIPLLLHKSFEHPSEIHTWFSSIKRNQMAKAALEMAVWDVYAKTNKQPLSNLIGGQAKEISVGISLGMEPTIDQTLEKIAFFLAEGYQRIKLKIKPGWDVQVVKAVREKFGPIPLMVDANSAYTLADVDVLKQLDPYDLLMIEQPLAHDDLIDHAVLQKQIQTPICLDESICSFDDARRAISIGSCKVINLKIGRVGGIAESIRIHDLCVEQKIDLWCGGMLEAGIGRAHNVALTTLPGFNLPGDTAGSNRYWHEDVITPEVVAKNGFIHVPTEYGIGYEINRMKLNEFVKKVTCFS